MQLQAYKGDETLKKSLVSEIRKHRKADQILKGTYGTEEDGKWRGCAVGCSIHSLNLKNGTKYNTDDHSVYEKELGIPEWLARLEDTLFENLPQEEAMLWPEKFAQAIPVGANLEAVKWHFCAFLMKENIERVLKLDIADNLKKQVVDAIQGVLSLHEKAIETGEWDESAAESATRSARWAAESATWAAESATWAARWAAESATWAAESATRSAESATRSARWAAESAARAAARAATRSARWAAESAARAAARAAEYQKYAKELLRLLKGAEKR